MAIDVNKVLGSPPQGLPIDGRHEQSRHAQEEVRSAIAAAAVAQEEERAKAVAESDIGVVLRELASVSIAFDRRLQFSINEKLGQVVVKVIDGETDKVIKEIPPAEIQHVHERIREVIGILFDERA